MSKSTFIGKPEARKDAYDKVTGKAKYVADICFENLKYGAVLRSKHHHALIEKIDISAAKKVKGVIDIITYDDLPAAKKIGVILQDRPVLAHTKVRFMGEPVAIIIADSKEVANIAKEAINVKYRPLTALFDPIDALSHNAEKVHEKGNLLASYELGSGNIEKGIKESDFIFEETFRLPTVYPGYLETETSIAKYEKNDNFTVWVSSQKPFDDRKHISKVLGIKEENITIKTVAIGGAFGGKEDSSLPIIAALAAWKIKESVKFVNNREESILGHPKRHASVIKCRIGVSKDGKIKFLDVGAFLNAGAYATYSSPVSLKLAEGASGVYSIPNVKVVTTSAYTNTLVAGAMRGFGAPQSNFAIESMIEIISEKLKINSIELRKQNILRKGDLTYIGAKINQAESIAECLNLAEKEINRLQKTPPSPNVKTGIGLALAVQTMGYGHGIPDNSTNSIECLSDGQIVINLGSPDIGQGLKTVAAQIVAEALQVDYSKIKVKDISTNTSPDGGVCCASRTTYCIGNSLLLAAKKLKKEMMAGKGLSPGKGLKCEATFSFPTQKIAQELPAGMPHVLFCFGAFIAAIEVDEALGLVKIKEFIGINDAGKVINLAGAEGQVEGGAAMGMGYALMESIKLKSDNTWNVSLKEYLMPTSLDIPPKIKSTFLENKEHTGPYGAKGIGEIALIPVASAISNAVFNATGKRFFFIPIMPYDLFKNVDSLSKGSTNQVRN